MELGKLKGYIKKSAVFCIAGIAAAAMAACGGEEDLSKNLVQFEDKNEHIVICLALWKRQTQT